MDLKIFGRCGFPNRWPPVVSALRNPNPAPILNAVPMGGPMRRIWSGLSTPQRLRRLRIALLTSVVLTLGGAATVFLGAREAATTVDEQVVPAATAISTIWNTINEVNDSLSGCSLADTADTDTAATDTADTDTVDCATILATGEYHAMIADVVQRLAVLAENKIGNAADRQTIQVIQGTLISYLGLVDQAHYYIGRDQSLLAEAYLTYASDLLSGDVHDELDDYRQGVLRKLTDQRESVYYGGWITLLWVIPLLASLALLVTGQLYITAQFNRWISPSLAAATLGVFLLGVGASQPVWSGETFDDAAADLQQVMASTIAPDGTLTAPSGSLASAADHAAASFNLEYLIPALTIIILALIIFGFQQRLDEYRLRSP